MNLTFETRILVTIGTNGEGKSCSLTDISARNEIKSKILVLHIFFQFDDSLLTNLLRIIQHMQLKKKCIANAKNLSDDKELLRETLPALAMPNVNADKLMTELEGLQPKWKEEKVRFFHFVSEIDCC